MKEQIPYFIEVPRATPSEVPVSVRVLGWSEIYGAYETGEAESQSARCIDCGNPYCSWGCPLHNRIPQWLKLVQQGRIEDAASLMHETNPLPEICGRICPQDRLCEGACTLETGFEAVTIGALELSEFTVHCQVMGEVKAPLTAPCTRMCAPGPASMPVYDGGAMGAMLSRQPTLPSPGASAPPSICENPPEPLERPPLPVTPVPPRPPEEPAVPLDPPVLTPASSGLMWSLLPTLAQPIEPDSPAASTKPMPTTR